MPDPTVVWEPVGPVRHQRLWPQLAAPGEEGNAGVDCCAVMISGSFSNCFLSSGQAPDAATGQVLVQGRHSPSPGSAWPRVGGTGVIARIAQISTEEEKGGPNWEMCLSS